MDKHEQQVARAEEASRLLNSPLFEAAFADTRMAILEAIAALPSMKDERASELHHMLGALAKAKRCLEIHIDTGKIAQKEIEGRNRGLLASLRRA